MDIATIIRLIPARRLMELAKATGAAQAAPWAGKTPNSPEDLLDAFESVTRAVIAPVREAFADGPDLGDIAVIGQVIQPAVTGMSMVTGVLAIPNVGNDDDEGRLLDPDFEGWATWFEDGNLMTKRALLFYGARHQLEALDPRFPHVELPLWDTIDGWLEDAATELGQSALDLLLYGTVQVALEAAVAMAEGGFEAILGGGDA